MKPNRKDHYLGCLLGGAIGDALGAPVEFDSLTEITRKFGPDGIQRYAPAYGNIGHITDDTQMTLFTAEGLLRAQVRGQTRGMVDHVSVVAGAYHRWLQTQGKQNHALSHLEPGDGWLFSQSELHSLRAPGNTCLSALQSMTRYAQPAQNDSKGCGGVMRVAPVGLYQHTLHGPKNLQSTFDLGFDVSALTHGHPSGNLPSGVMAVLIQSLVSGTSISDGIAVALQFLKQRPDHQETLESISKAVSLAKSDWQPPDAIRKLGEGWVAEEALAIALYCALKSEDFSDAVRMAVNHDGDTDSTGAIAGNLVGATLGVSAIAPHWIEPLELKKVIQQIAEDLYEFPNWKLDDDDLDNESARLHILERYPGY